MPCSCDGYPDPDRIAVPALCAIVRLHGPGIVDGINWKEAGITPLEFDEWWAMHKRRDDERRKREIRDEQRKQLKKQAFSKLTKEEIASLAQD